MNSLDHAEGVSAEIAGMVGGMAPETSAAVFVRHPTIYLVPALKEVGQEVTREETLKWQREAFLSALSEENFGTPLHHSAKKIIVEYCAPLLFEIPDCIRGKEFAEQLRKIVKYVKEFVFPCLFQAGILCSQPSEKTESPHREHLSRIKENAAIFEKLWALCRERWGNWNGNVTSELLAQDIEKVRLAITQAPEIIKLLSAEDETVFRAPLTRKNPMQRGGQLLAHWIPQALEYQEVADEGALRQEESPQSSFQIISQFSSSPEVFSRLQDFFTQHMWEQDPEFRSWLPTLLADKKLQGLFTVLEIFRRGDKEPPHTRQQVVRGLVKEVFVHRRALLRPVYRTVSVGQMYESEIPDTRIQYISEFVPWECLEIPE